MKKITKSYVMLFKNVANAELNNTHHHIQCAQVKPILRPKIKVNSIIFAHLLMPLISGHPPVDSSISRWCRFPLIILRSLLFAQID